MARTVSVPRNAETVAYAAFDFDDEDAAFYYDDAVDGFVYAMKKRYPSLRPANTWIGREDRAVLANDKVYVTVSEYCGLVAVAAVPKDPDSKRDCAYAAKMNLSAVECFGTPLVKVGTFSNGEAVYRCV